MDFELRAWRMSDAKDLAAALSNPNILNNLRDGIPYPYTEGDAASYISVMQKADPNTTFAYAITVEDRAIGSIGVFRQGNIHARTAELGYYLAEEYWGKGIMSEAVRSVCKRVFAETDILRIFAEPFSYNTASRRVLEKAGFCYEGLLRCNAVKHGRVEDMALYALTKCETRVKRLSFEELPAALSLIWEVFQKFEAPVYPQEGIDEFRASLDNAERNARMHFYGAYEDNSLIGVLAMRAPQHIGYFFVREDCQHRGVGKRLFETIRRDYSVQAFTVNAAPYAVDIYRHLGFVPTDTEQITNGIRYTPMRLVGGNSNGVV